MNNMSKLKFILFFVYIIFFVSCSKEPIANYKNSIVYEKSTNLNQTELYIIIQQYDTINHNYNFKKIRVMQYDYEMYNVGDIIK